MSYREYEESNYSGAPRILYEFRLGSNRWRYTNAQTTINVSGAIYRSISISHDEIAMSGEPNGESLTIQIAPGSEVARLFIGTPPSDTLSVVIRAQHRGDPDAVIIWSGIVKSGKRTSAAEFEIICNSLMSTLNRNGLRLSWGRSCPFALYDRSCKVVPSDYSVTGQVASMGGSVVRSNAFAAFPDRYFSGGFVAFVGEYGTTERRAVERHVGNTLTFMGNTDGISVGNMVTAYPGCDRITSTCQSKFNNLANYGGFPHLPNKSPFDGDPVF